MYNLIMADVYKIRKSKAIKVLFGITTISAVTMAVMAYLIPQGKIDAGMIGIGFMLSDVNMISILGAVIAAVFICGDFDNKIIHEAIATGNSRGSVIVGKAIAFSCSLIFILIPYAIVTGVALGTGHKFSMGSIAVGFLNVLTLDAGKALVASEIWKLLAVMLTLFIVYVAQLSVCVPLALALKKPVLVVAVYYGVTILCAQLTRLRNSSQIFDNIFASTPYGGNYTFLTLDSGTGDILKAISVSIIFMIAMFAVTYFSFRKSEIK